MLSCLQYVVDNRLIVPIQSVIHNNSTSAVFRKCAILYRFVWIMNLMVITTLIFTQLVWNDPVMYSSMELTVGIFGRHLPGAVLSLNSIYDLQMTVFFSILRTIQSNAKLCIQLSNFSHQNRCGGVPSADHLYKLSSIRHPFIVSFFGIVHIQGGYIWSAACHTVPDRWFRHICPYAICTHACTTSDHSTAHMSCHTARKM